jgi:hypothetical protein
LTHYLFQFGISLFATIAGVAIEHHFDLEGKWQSYHLKRERKKHKLENVDKRILPVDVKPGVARFGHGFDVTAPIILEQGTPWFGGNEDNGQS